MNELRLILRTVGSLWFAAVLLTLLLVAMACATVFESTHGSERALATFYRSWWFKTLLALLCVNVTAALLLRYPFSRKLIGFVVTHAAIVVVLTGALIGACFGVDGQVALIEGETTEYFSNVQRDALTILNRRDQTKSSIDLDAPVFAGFRVADHPQAPSLILGDANVSVLRYLPDSVGSWPVLDDNDPRLGPAVEVSLSPSGRADPTWAFAGQPETPGAANIVYRVIPDPAEWARLVGEQPSSGPTSVGMLKVDYQNATFEITLEDCMNSPAALGDTGYTIRVVRYLPHAIVGEDNRLTNAPDHRDNPAVEVEIAGPSETETRIAFARFPGFRHGANQIDALDVTFVATSDPTPIAPVEVLRSPDGGLYARFSHTDTPIVSDELDIGTPVETPWPGLKFAVLRHFEHARVVEELEPVDPIRNERTPAVALQVTTPQGTAEVWVQKHQSQVVRVGDTPYEIAYGSKPVALGFALTLNRLRIGTYPGESTPRSFESQIATVDPVTGRAQSHVISMNNPLEHGGYTLYQLRASQQRDRQGISVLGVTRDPGQPVVFTGYIVLMIGMVIVLGTRMAERRPSRTPLRVNTATG